MEYVDVCGDHETSWLTQSLSHILSCPGEKCKIFSSIKSEGERAYLLAQPHQKIVRLHVSVNEVLAVDELDTTDELVSQQEDGLQAHLPVAEVEEILQTGPEELHHHHVVVVLGAVVLHQWDPNPSLHHLHQHPDLLFHFEKNCWEKEAGKQCGLNWKLVGKYCGAAD